MTTTGKTFQAPHEAMRNIQQTPRRIVFIAANGAAALDIVGPMEVFATASGIFAKEGRPAPYSLVLASPGGGVMATRTGLDILTHPLEALPAGEIDTIVIAGRGHEGEAHERAVAWVRQHGRSARRLCSVCVGTFVLAEAGLLHGKSATTHWHSLERFAADFPRTEVQAGKIFVRDGSTWTSAGMLTGIDLALQLVEDDLGRDIAMRIAKLLVTFARRSADEAQQSAMLAMQSTLDADFSGLMSWITRNIDTEFQVGDLAARAGMTPRTFARRFKEATGTTPADAVTRIRAEAARQLLTDRQRSFKEVAVLVGFKTELNLRRALHRHGPAA